MTIPITGQPPIPGLSDPATFNTRALNLLTWLTGSMLDQFNAVDPADWFGVQASPTDIADGKVVLNSGLAEMFCGSVAYFAMVTPPAGWIKANGARVSRTTYARLFSKIGIVYGAGDGSTTFNLPDLRGEFIRGWDNGRGLDAGRAFASVQGHDVQSHKHAGSADVQGVHSHTNTLVVGSGGGGTALHVSDPVSGEDPTPRVTTNAAGAHSHNITIGFAGGPETRPRNVAALACIKY